MQQVLSISSLGEMLSQECTPDHTGVKIREKIIMMITSNNLDAFRNDFNKAMADLQEKYDVTISLGNITFEEERFLACSPGCIIEFSGEQIINSMPSGDLIQRLKSIP